MSDAPRSYSFVARDGAMRRLLVCDGAMRRLLVCDEAARLLVCDGVLCPLAQGGTRRGDALRYMGMGGAIGRVRAAGSAGPPRRLRNGSALDEAGPDFTRPGLPRRGDRTPAPPGRRMRWMGADGGTRQTRSRRDGGTVSERPGKQGQARPDNALPRESRSARRCPPRRLAGSGSFRRRWVGLPPPQQWSHGDGSDRRDGCRDEQRLTDGQHPYFGSQGRGRGRARARRRHNRGRCPRGGGR